MRGGTTFTGDILSSHPDVFYLYETSWFSEDRTHSLRRADASVVDSRRIITKLQTCDYTEPELREFMKYQVRRGHYARSHAISRELGCDDPLLMRRLDKCRPLGKKCAETPSLWQRACRSHRVHVFKILRLHVVDVAPLAATLAATLAGVSVKFILLTRDPRGVLTSRERHKFVALHLRSPDVCYNMAENYDSAAALNLSSDVLKVIRYEDVADHPEVKVREIYDFVGLPYLPETDAYIALNTRGETGSDAKGARGPEVVG
ncbi:PREDICTED: carbohydrate sulfotransferase 4-like [Priapulus caudatus]|uniref:Carbohydrate sulfotransferase 4-like n=1 Tax=Priapulus caudatus TaxID=37621 RepID=A0ABM1F5I7_PRICU|nr:PREDICTED: carbohydrate sulfotransferase 4-like [Priapulus caudatus]